MSIVMDDYCKEIDESVKKTLERIKKEKESQVKQDVYPLSLLREKIREIASSLYGQNIVSAIDLSVPPPEIQSDFAIGAFSLSKQLKKSPSLISAELAQAINSAGLKDIQKAVATGPYINIFVEKNKFYSDILQYTNSMGDEYGRTFANKGKTVVIDYSSPNIAKPLGVGHLRSTIIGQALGNIYEWTGFSVVRDNHLGDWGTQFGELIYAYKKWSDGDIKEDHIRKLKDLYVRFHNELKENPDLKQEARKIFKELENGNEELFSLWKKFRDWSIEGFNRVYSRLGVKFDLYIGESYFAPHPPIL